MSYGMIYGIGIWTPGFTSFAVAVLFAFAIFCTVLFRNWHYGMPVVVRVYGAPVAHRARRTPRKARHREHVPAWRAMFPR